MAPPRGRVDGPTVRLLLAVAAMLVLVVAGFVAVAAGLVPQRVPVATLDGSGLTHDFPDLERVLPPVVRGRAAEDLNSLDGESAIDDESMFGGLYSALVEELLPARGPGPGTLDTLQIAQELIPGHTDGDWTGVSLFRLPGRTSEGWQAGLDRLLAGEVEYQLWTFRSDIVGGRPVLVGTDDEGHDSDWIYRSGDRAYEIMSDDKDLVAAVLAALP